MANKGIEDQIMNRRAFLENTGKIGAGVVLGSLPILNSCKGSPTIPDPPPPPPPPPVSVNLEFTIYNHTKGLKGNFRKDNVLSESVLQILVSELMSQYGINDVDDKSIIIKKTYLGMTVAKSFAGTAGLTVPRENTSYDIFLLNIDGKELYAANEASNYPLKLEHTRKFDVYRADFNGLAGDEKVFGGEFIPEIGKNGIIDQFNNALSPGGLPFSYGSITRKPMPNDGKGEFGYGFGDCHGHDAVAAIPSSYYTIDWVGVDPRVANTIKWQVGAGLGALFEKIVRGGFELVPGIGQRAQQVIQRDGVLNAKGKDFIAYMYLRDWTGK